MTVTILNGDCRDILKTMPDQSVNCVVTSPPYFGLRDYGVDGQIGLEDSPDAFVAEMVAVFREVRRVLRDDGTLWLKLGDSYAGSWGAQGRGGQLADRSVISAQQIAAAAKKATKTGSIAEGSGLKPKDLIGIPWRVAFALQADGWFLRQDIIWHKPNPMPESVTDRCTKAHEYVFLLTKRSRYFYDAEAISEARESDEDSKTFRGGCYVSGEIDNGAMGTPAMAESSLRTAAIAAAGVDVCGAEVGPGVIRALVTQGSEEERITLEAAAFITLGMKLAYLDIIARTDTAAEFCSATKTARIGQ